MGDLPPFQGLFTEPVDLFSEFGDDPPDPHTPVLDLLQQVGAHGFTLRAGFRTILGSCEGR